MLFLYVFHAVINIGLALTVCIDYPILRISTLINQPGVNDMKLVTCIEGSQRHIVGRTISTGVLHIAKNSESSACGHAKKLRLCVSIDKVGEICEVCFPAKEINGLFLIDIK